jgi:hypothetical protein
VRRPRLSEAAARSLAGVMAGEMQQILGARTDLAPGLLHGLQPRPAARRPVGGAHSWGMDEEGFLQAARKVQVPECARFLAALNGLPAGVVARSLALQCARVLVALCWQAGLSARAAAVAQVTLAGSTREELLVLPGGGWAMTPEEMRAETDALLAPPVAGHA